MKVTFFLTALLALASFAMPAVASGPALERAVALSAPGSKASLSAICESVYDAVKESPEEADKAFSSVLSQRTNWKASEVYAIFRAILLARPDLAGNLSSYVAANKGGKDGKGVYVGGGDSSDSNKTRSVEMDPMLYRLMNTLYEASLPDGVAEKAVNMLVMTISGVYDASYAAVNENGNINTNRAPGGRFGIIPTPGDMTTAN